MRKYIDDDFRFCVYCLRQSGIYTRVVVEWQIFNYHFVVHFLHTIGIPFRCDAIIKVWIAIDEVFIVIGPCVFEYVVPELRRSDV